MTSELLNALAQTTLATGFTFLCTAAGAAAVFFMKPGNGRGRGAELAETLSLGFAAGIMIAASVWSLIIPAQEMAQAQGGTPWLAAGSGVAAGALFLKLLDTRLFYTPPSPQDGVLSRVSSSSFKKKKIEKRVKMKHTGICNVSV